MKSARHEYAVLSKENRQIRLEMERLGSLLTESDQQITE